MTQVYIGNLDSRVTEKELDDEFNAFGVIRNLWIARNPPGFAFVDFANSRDAQDAVRELDGKNGWKVQLSRRTRGGGRGRLGRAGFDSKCYECGEPGHFARQCRNRGGARYRRSPSFRRSPRGRSPRRRSVSPRQRSYNRSPPYPGREDDKHANRNGLRDRRRSGS